MKDLIYGVLFVIGLIALIEYGKRQHKHGWDDAERALRDRYRQDPEEFDAYVKDNEEKDDAHDLAAEQEAQRAIAAEDLRM